MTYSRQPVMKAALEDGTELAAQADLAIKQSGYSYYVVVTDLVHALDLGYGDRVAVTLEVKP